MSSLELATRFEAAISRISDAEAPNLKRYWRTVFDGLVIEAQKNGKSIFDLADQLEAMASMSKSTPVEVRSKQVGLRSSSLHILVVTPIFPSIEHGGGVQLFDLITELASRGHRVDLYSRRDPGGTTSLELLKGSLQRYHLVDGVGLSTAGYRNWLEQSSVEFDVIQYVFPGAAELIIAGKPFARNSVFEIIESRTRRSVIELEAALKDRNVHTVAPLAFVLARSWTTERAAVEAADSVFALTEVDAEFTSKAFAFPEVGVVPQGLSKTLVLDRVRDRPEEDEPSHGTASAIFLGNFDHQPNRDGLSWFLSEVHPKVCARVPSFKLVVAGFGDASDVRARFEKNESVLFLGPVEDLVGTLRSARICLAPLITGAGMRGKINQYSAVRRPTVATTVGASGMPYVHEQSIMIADDPEAFASHVAALVTDDSLYERMRYAAEKVALENFGWGPIIDRLEAIYRSTKLNGKPHGEECRR